MPAGKPIGRISFSDVASAPWRLVIRAGVPLFALILAFNALIMLIVMPVLNWIFEEALRSAGMVTLAMIIRALHLIALYVALRLSLAVAVFVRTSESGWDAMKTSWRLTAGWRCCLSCRKSSRGPQFLT